MGVSEVGKKARMGRAPARVLRQTLPPWKPTPTALKNPGPRKRWGFSFEKAPILAPFGTVSWTREYRWFTSAQSAAQSLRTFKRGTMANPRTGSYYRDARKEKR